MCSGQRRARKLYEACGGNLVHVLAPAPNSSCICTGVCRVEKSSTRVPAVIWLTVYRRFLVRVPFALRVWDATKWTLPSINTKWDATKWTLPSRALRDE
eukprot:4335509-Pyramimonas_sp.AAC.1